MAATIFAYQIAIGSITIITFYCNIFLHQIAGYPLREPEGHLVANAYYIITSWKAI
jgi:hypothetical protein